MVFTSCKQEKCGIAKVFQFSWSNNMFILWASFVLQMCIFFFSTLDKGNTLWSRFVFVVLFFFPLKLLIGLSWLQAWGSGLSYSVFSVLLLKFHIPILSLLLWVVSPFLCLPNFWFVLSETFLTSLLDCSKFILF